MRQQKQQLTRYKRVKRAKKAAEQRWRNKQRLVPGGSSWSTRSLANSQRHMAAAIRGGEATRAKYAAQARTFWHWFYAGVKAEASGPIRTVIDTFEHIEADFENFAAAHGGHSANWDRWDAFVHFVMSRYVANAAWTQASADIESEMWSAYRELRDADTETLETLLKPMCDYERQEGERQATREMFRGMRAG